VAREFGIPVISIANLDDLFGYLAAHMDDPALAQFKDKVAAYRTRYGV
jgi:orotate phosphoribosyltransferase